MDTTAATGTCSVATGRWTRGVGVGWACSCDVLILDCTVGWYGGLEWVRHLVCDAPAGSKTLEVHMQSCDVSAVHVGCVGDGGQVNDINSLLGVLQCKILRRAVNSQAKRKSVRYRSKDDESLELAAC